MTPWNVDLIADRWTPFSDGFQFPPGIDLTGATLHAQIRAYRDAPGAPLVDLQAAASTAEGLSIDTVTDEETTLVTSTVRMRINETTLEGLARTNPVGGDLVLAWDLHVTVAGVGGKRRWIAGSFLLRAGATQ